MRCTMGVGCDEYGVCYADAHDRPDMCPVYDWADDARKSYDLAIKIKRERGDKHYTNPKETF